MAVENKVLTYVDPDKRRRLERRSRSRAIEKSRKKKNYIPLLIIVFGKSSGKQWTSWIQVRETGSGTGTDQNLRVFDRPTDSLAIFTKILIFVIKRSPVQNDTTL